QQRFGKALVDLAPEARDVHVDDVGLRVEVVVPDVLEQHRAGDDLAGMLHEVFEQPELARLQHDGLAGARHLVGEAVEREVADAVAGGLLLGGGPAHQRLDAGEQLGVGVRLGEVVVAAGAQALDAVVHLAQRREDEDGRARALGAQRLHHRQAVAARQHAVDDQHVVAALARHGETVLAVAGDVGGMPALAQRSLQELRRLTVVFDHEHTHGTGRRLLSGERGKHGGTHWSYPRNGAARRPAQLTNRPPRRDLILPTPSREGRQLFFSWTATKRVCSPDLTRTSTALRPSLVASLMPLARSSGFFTDRPPTSRITSPDLMPFWAASEALSTSVTTTPSLL